MRGVVPLAENVRGVRVVVGIDWERKRMDEMP